MELVSQSVRWKKPATPKFKQLFLWELVKEFEPGSYGELTHFSCCFQYLFVNMQKLTAGHKVSPDLCVYWTCTTLQYTSAATETVLRDKTGQLRVFPSREQNSGRNSSTDMGKKSFKNVANFRYL